MLDFKLIREKPEKVKRACLLKGVNPKFIDDFLEKDKKLRRIKTETEEIRAQHNQLVKKFKDKKIKAVGGQFPKEFQEDYKKAFAYKQRLKVLGSELRTVEEEYQNLIFQIPNPPADDVPEGKDETENVEVRKWGEPTKFDFKPKDHLELGELLDIIDVKRAAKVSGSRFGYLKNEAVLLEFALVNYCLETLNKEGFRPVVPPVMIKKEMMRGMGFWEHGGQEDMYILEKDDLVLVGTSEQSLGPMHAQEIFDEKDLPRRYFGFSTCFRREAGSYGKDTRGIFRVHQFDKVEMFSFIKPQEEADKKEHEYLLSLEERLVQALAIPYQVTKMCTGDLALPQARKFDVNCWFPSENAYRETHSTSTCTDFQARRLDIRYREKGKNEFVHTLNGTAFAVGRMILAILENYQQEDGSVLIPKILQPYVGKKQILPKS